MASVKKELVLGCFALAIAAVFLFANRWHYYDARYEDRRGQTWPTVRVHKFTGRVEEWKAAGDYKPGKWAAWKTGLYMAPVPPPSQFRP